ncbi:MAG: cyclic nucleotide-binding domain-containing protein [Anaerolineales bacterium]|nr:cyclic nucleotide-binding domain-containing protein [Anaerolineales bacterium]
MDIASFLGGLYLFKDLPDQEIHDLAGRFSVIKINEGEVLRFDEEIHGWFFIIIEGRFLVRTVENTDKDNGKYLVSGDFFGEDALLFGETNLVSVHATRTSKLLCLNSDQFINLLQNFPHVRRIFKRTYESRRMAQNLRFDWINDNEVIYQVTRKHDAHLLVSLFGPFVICLVALLLLFYVSMPEIESSVWFIGLVISAILFLVGILWGIWDFIDWGNDYYIVTNQRVVWVEKVIMLYDSREEAPLTTIRSVDVKTNLLGRLLGYGDIIVNTYTGRILMRIVGQPFLMAAMIEEYWHRAQRRIEEEESEAMESAIRRQLGQIEEQETQFPQETDSEPEPPRVKTHGIWQNYFSNFLKMRFVDGNVITYRKFWLILIKKTWKPVLAGMIVCALMVYIFYLYLVDPLRVSDLWLGLIGGGVLSLGVIFLWWAYLYVDWRNDIYQVTERYIFDIERRPLGTEIKKSAPLESILSLEHERQGFLGYLFNYGNVTINVGDAKFVFRGIFDPARAQQDVFNRMYALRRAKEKSDAERERARIASALSMYHRNLSDQEGDLDNNEGNLT